MPGKLLGRVAGRFGRVEPWWWLRGVRAALLARGAEPGLVRFDVSDSGAPISWTRRRTEECGAPWPVGTGRRAPTATIQGVTTEAGSDEDLIPQASTAITVSSALAGTS